MTVSDDNKDPDRPKRISRKALSFSEYCKRRQQYHAQKATEFGYSQEVWEDLSSKVQSSSDVPVFDSLESAIDKFKFFIEEKENESEYTDFDVSSASYAIATATSVVTSSAISVGGDSDMMRFTSPSPPNGWAPERHERYATKLGSLDPELGRICRSIWQSFYGGAEDGARTSLFSMRQLYDYFFSTIAPDERVKVSNCFVEKEGPKKNQIYRRERICYAAQFVVADASLGEALEAQAGYVVSLYEQLNKIHKRGPLDRHEVKGVLISMQTVIEEWVDALGL